MIRCTNSPLVAAAIIALAGCSNTPKQEARIETPQPPLRASTANANAQPATTGAVQETESQKFGRLIKSVEGRSVYFAYDDFTIRNEYPQVVDAHADVLRKAGKGKVVVEGNADERGSREYNLALGQKRAEAGGKALRTLGIPADRIEAISFGKEKPRAVCHEEKCWAENRRIDFSYKLK